MEKILQEEMEEKRKTILEDCYDIENQGYYKDIVMSYLRELLKFLGDVRNICNNCMDNFSGNIVLMTGNDIFHVSTDKNEAAEQLNRIFWEFYKKDTNVIYIMEKGVDKYRKYKKDPKKKFRMDIKSGRDIQVLDEIIEYTNNSFIEADIKNRLENRIKVLIKDYDKTTNEWFIKENIISYLNHYYEVLRNLICENGLLETEGVVEEILVPLLKLGVHWDDESNNGEISLNSPVFLSGINIIYDKLNEYLYMEIEDDEIEEIIYREIFLNKIKQMFRYHIIRKKNGELCNAALPPYKEDDGNIRMRLPVRPLSDYNSFQGIRELRLAEKILFELENLGNEKLDELKNRPYRVYLLGDIYERPMEKLIDYLEKALSKKRIYKKLKTIKIDFWVYTLKAEQFNNISKGNYNCKFVVYDNTIQERPKLESVLKVGDLFFFLDNCQLYDMYVEEIKDLIVFRQYISYDTYEEYYKNNPPQDLTLDCKFMEMYNALVTYARTGQLGYTKKKVKEVIVKYIRDYISKENGKTAYVYISDLHAVNALKCIKERIVRIEKYNQKQIGIIRFSGEDKQKLPIHFSTKDRNDEGSYILVFNMWQFVKHIALNQKHQFEKEFLSDTQNQLLDEIYIGIDYTNWETEINISYWNNNEGEIDYTNLDRFIRIILAKVFSGEDRDMYQKYLKESFVSFLYGTVKSVEDLIFLHIFKNKGKQLGTLKFAERKYWDEKLKRFYNVDCKYSYKKIYWETIEKFDVTTVDLIKQYLIMNAIKEDSYYVALNRKYNPVKKLLTDIIDACKNIQYADSDLYEKCLDRKQIIN